MQPSRLVVLAAGVGSRLEPKVGAKPLVRVGGMTLLERSIVAAHEAGFDEVVVVTGHEHDRVARHALDVSRRRGFALTSSATRATGRATDSPCSPRRTSSAMHRSRW